MSPESTETRQNEASPAERAARWCAGYIDALLGADVSGWARLVTEAADLPPEFMRLIDTRIAPATGLLRGGNAGRAAGILTDGVPQLGPVLTATLEAGPSAVTGNDDLRAALTHGLTGAWLESAGFTGPAAVSYYESGRHFGWLGQEHAQTSFDLLTRANTLDPAHVDTYWLLANAWFLRSFTDASALQTSLDMWNRGAALQHPAASSSWAYVLRALIGEEMARGDDQKRFSSRWEGVVFLERAILVNDQDALRWANLGRLHRLLGNEATCLHATGQAFQRDPEDPTVLDERAAVLADTGAGEEALKVIGKRLEKEPSNVWARGVKAYILMHQKEYQAALGLIDGVIAAEPSNIWNLDVRAACCRMLGDRAGADAAYSRILESSTASPPLSSEDTRTCAFAAYNLGRADLAISMLEKPSSDPADTDDRMRLLGLCYLATGRVARAEELLLGGLARANVREVDEFLSMDLPGAEKALAAAPQLSGVTAMVKRVRRVAEALLAELGRIGIGDVARETETELTLLIQTARESDAGRWIEAGARAGVARLQLESSRWHDAATHYRALRASGIFPEAEIGFERAVDGLRSVARQNVEKRRFTEAAHEWEDLLTILADATDDPQVSAVRREIGDALWQGGDATGALAEFQKSLAAMPVPGDRESAAALHARIALVRQQLGDLAAARSSLIDSLRLFTEAGRIDPGRALGETYRPLILDIGHFWQVEAQWAEIEMDQSSDEAARRALASARESLLAYLDAVCQMGEMTDATKMLPVVVPIALEVGSDLVPLVDSRIDGGKFLGEDIPTMRQRIESTTGVERMPGIRVREDGVSRDGYVLLLDGAPAARDSVRIGLRYTPLALAAVSALGIVSTGFEEVTDPVTYMPGVWCPESSWEELTSHGVTPLTETQFILRHVEDVLRQHLDMFLGVQEAEELIARFTSDAQAPEAIRSSLANARERLLFARVLRALARERVPLTAWTAIADGVQAAGWSTVPDLVREIRLRLETQLPGNEAGTTLVRVPREWPMENGSAGRVPSRADISPETAHRMLIEVREWLLPHTAPVALVTADAAFRPMLRRLIDFEFPTVPVLSEDEVTARERVAPVAQVAAQGISQES